VVWRPFVRVRAFVVLFRYSGCVGYVVLFWCRELGSVIVFKWPPNSLKAFYGVVGFGLGPVSRSVGCGSHNNRGQADRFPQCRVCG